MGLKQAMNSYERVMAVLNRSDFDVYPAINPTSVATLSSMQRAQAYLPAAHLSPQRMADLASQGHEHFGFDSVMPYFSVLMEASALGVETEWGDANQTPYARKPCLYSMDDLHLPANLFERREFQAILSACSLLSARYKGRVAVIGKVVGPWTLAFHLRGVENLALDVILEPEKTKAFIEELASIPIAFARLQFEAGADLMTWADHCTSDLASRQIYADFLAPVHRRANRELRQMGPTILHKCGNIMDRIEDISGAGFSVIHLDSRNDLPEAVRIVGDRALLAGAVNNPFVLAQGSPQDVRREVLANIHSGIRLIAPECAIPCSVSDDNLASLVRTAHQTPGPR